MRNTLHHLHCHIKNHHKKYLFGIFGGFAVVKLFLLILGLSVVQYSNIPTFAEGETGCVLTGQYYTGEYQTGGYLTGQELTGGYLTGCITLSGYRTGGFLDESGTLTGEYYTGESQTGCFLTGQEFTGGYMTGYYFTGGYRTGGYLTGCIQNTGNTQTGNNQTGNMLSGNGICESGDIVRNSPLSGSIVRNIFPMTWTYSGTDCLASGISLQLRDHNNQRISLGTFAPGTASYSFDSRRLYSFQSSGFYHIIGNTGGGNFYLYSGTYSGTYSRFFTGYKVRLLTLDQTPVYETPTFTIDNQNPTLTGLALLSNGSATGYLTLSGTVTLAFTASEDLSGLQVTLGSGIAPTTSTVSGLSYIYTRTLTSLYPEGVLAANISFADKAGNTGAVTYTSSLIFDKTKPTVTGFLFNDYLSGLRMVFAASEAVRYTLNYRKTGGSFLTGASAEYLATHQAVFSGVERNQLYAFRLDAFDRAGNSRSVTGDVLWTNSGIITFHTYIVPVTDTVILSGSLAILGTVLRAEIAKFNVCKSALTYTPVELEVRRTAFIIQMPTFKKSQVKTLVSAFTLFILDKVKHDYTISSDEVAEITKKFDSFLIILKLLRDDDNTCKQNLSNYHISQFKKALEEFNISLE